MMLDRGRTRAAGPVAMNPWRVDNANERGWRNLELFSHTTGEFTRDYVSAAPLTRSVHTQPRSSRAHVHKSQACIGHPTRTAATQTTVDSSAPANSTPTDSATPLIACTVDAHASLWLLCLASSAR
jgi:hypothetical protein